jgi:hypothetical protein
MVSWSHGRSEYGGKNKHVYFWNGTDIIQFEPSKFRDLLILIHRCKCIYTASVSQLVVQTLKFLVWHVLMAELGTTKC